MKQIINVPSHTIQIHEIMKESILGGKYKPGDRLNETELAESLGVSRSPIREAIQRLAMERLVELVPRRGVFVAKLTLEMVEELFELREVLEIKSAELAAIRITEDELNKLSKLLVDTSEAIQRKQYRQYPWNLDFHKQIANCTRNRYLEEKIYDINAHLLLLRQKSSAEIGRAAKAFQEHNKIFEALKKRDANLANQLMKEHIHLSKKNVISLLTD